MQVFYEGANHPHIAFFQQGLSRAGHPPGAYDGIYGAKTRQALGQFRMARKMEDTAAITKADWDALAPFLLGYVRHTVKSGETLFSLVKYYHTKEAAILAANPKLQAGNLQVGEMLTIPLDFDLVPTQIPFTSLVLSYVVQGMRARYPKIRGRVIGKSLAGREIPVLLFGEGGHHVSYNAAHHGNEWITTPLLLKFLESYAKAEAEDGQIAGHGARERYQNATLHLMPMVGPDGVDIATGALNTGPEYEYAVYLSQHYPHIPFPTGWKANARGVDLNLQYPAGWEKAEEIKFSQGFTLPGPRDYVGKSPLSEPESRAMYEYTMKHHFALTLSYHSQGQVIYWKYLDHLPPNSLEIGRKFAELSGYLLEETPYVSGHAGYKDWFIQQFNKPGYTMEVGLGESPLPLSQFDKIYGDNLPVLATGLLPFSSM